MIALGPGRQCDPLHGSSQAGELRGLRSARSKIVRNCGDASDGKHSRTVQARGPLAMPGLAEESPAGVSTARCSNPRPVQCDDRSEIAVNSRPWSARRKQKNIVSLLLIELAVSYRVVVNLLAVKAAVGHHHGFLFS